MNKFIVDDDPVAYKQKENGRLSMKYVDRESGHTIIKSFNITAASYRMLHEYARKNEISDSAALRALIRLGSDAAKDNGN